MEIIARKLMNKEIGIDLGGEKLRVYFWVSQYSLGGATCVQLRDKKDHSPVATLTVNIREVKLKEREILAKTWSENEEIARAVLASGLFMDTGKRIKTGFVEAQVWECYEGGES